MKILPLNQEIAPDSVSPPYLSPIVPNSKASAWSKHASHGEVVAQAAKRLDWRFFLPTPSLEQVTYIGSADSSLAQALALFTTDLTIFPTTELNQRVNNVYKSQQRIANKRLNTPRLVVAQQPTPDTLQRALESFGTNTVFYLELYGALQFKRYRRGNLLHELWQHIHLWQPQDYLRILQNSGLTETQILWVWPNFEQAQSIIPIDHLSAIDTVSMLNMVGMSHFDGYSNETMVLPQWAKWLLHYQWFSQLLPYYSIIAYKRMGE